MNRSITCNRKNQSNLLNRSSHDVEQGKRADATVVWLFGKGGLPRASWQNNALALDQHEVKGRLFLPIHCKEYTDGKEVHVDVVSCITSSNCVSTVSIDRVTLCRQKVDQYIRSTFDDSQRSRALIFGAKCSQPTCRKRLMYKYNQLLGHLLSVIVSMDKVGSSRKTSREKEFVVCERTSVGYVNYIAGVVRGYRSMPYVWIQVELVGGWEDAGAFSWVVWCKYLSD